MKTLASIAVLLFVSSLPVGAVAAEFDAILYKNPACGCCLNYVAHLERAGLRVVVQNTDDVDVVKLVYGVPDELASCHTMLIGGYVVEGHVPVAAVVRLLSERPDITGIALAGMPAGSPGMAGPQTEPFTVYGFSLSAPPEVFAVE